MLQRKVMRRYNRFLQIERACFFVEKDFLSVEDFPLNVKMALFRPEIYFFSLFVPAMRCSLRKMKGYSLKGENIC